MKEKKQGLLKRILAVLLSVFMIVSGLPGYVEEVSAENHPNITVCPNCRKSDWNYRAVVEERTCQTGGKTGQKCNNCGYVAWAENNPVAPLDHDYSVLVSDSATCTATGTRVYKCKWCTSTTKVASSMKSHTWGATIHQAPTCGAPGRDYSKCTVCGTESSGTVIPPTNSHTYQEIRKEPTCVDNGSVYNWCSTCGNTTSTQVLAATGLHDWKETSRTEPSCFKDGTIYLKCSVCGKTSTQGIKQIGSHNISTKRTEPTCGADGSIVETCSRCDYKKTTVLSATGLHDWKETSRKEASCFKDGTIYLKCSVCGKTSTQGIKQIGSHNISTKRTEPTCGADGSIVETCSRCDYKKTTVLSATGLHDWKETSRKEASCFKDGTIYLKCSVCGKTSTQGIKQIGSHNYVTKRTEPTCGEAGSVYEECSRCGDKTTPRTLDPTNKHTWKETGRKEASCFTDGTVYLECSVCKKTTTQGLQRIGSHAYVSKRTEPTCVKDGSIVETCSRCGDKKTTVLKATGVHNYVVISDTAPDCGHEGAKVSRCTMCGAEVAEKKSPVGDHDWKLTKTVGATCIADGYKLYTCSVCNTTRKDTINKTGVHDYKVIKDTAPDCGHEGVKVVECKVCGKQGTTVKPPAGDHSWKLTKTVGATCTTDGYKLYTCSVCNTTRKDTIKRTGVHDYKVIKNTAPDCGHEGSTVSQCSMCGAQVATTTPPVGTHKWSVTKTVAATCINDGYTISTCSVCKNTKKDTIKKTGVHDYKVVKETAPDCGHEGASVAQCTMCGHQVASTTPPVGTHIWSVTKTVAATCVNDGYTISTCSVCKNTKKDTIKKTGVHDYKVIKNTAPDCGHEGATVSQCTMCGAQVATTTPPVGTHKWSVTKTVAATCVNDGYTISTCSVCKNTKKDTIKKTGVHDYKVVKETAPDCGHEGASVAQCTMCGHQVATTTPPVGEHRWSVTKTEPATCITDGYTLSTCSVCKKTKKDPIKRTGVHDFKTVKDTAPDCGHEGATVAQCTMCGTQVATVKPPVGDHHWEVTKIVEANCGTTGTKISTCSVCGKTKTDTLPTTGTHVCELYSEIAPTCGKAGQKISKCTICGKEFGENIPPVGEHQWEVEERVEPTTEKEGKLVRVCSVCGQRMTEPLDKLTSSSSSIVLSASTTFITFGKSPDSRAVTLGDVNATTSIHIEKPDWLTVSRAGNIFTVSASENKTGAERTGSVTFIDETKGRTVSVRVLQAAADYCIISFDTNGGLGAYKLADASAPQGQTLYAYLPAAPAAPENKVFDGWYDSKNGGTQYTGSMEVPYQSRLQLYAHWADKNYTIIYEGNGADSGSMENTPAECNKRVQLAANRFKKSGYRVESWNTEKDGSGKKIAREGSVYNLIDGYAAEGTTVTLYAQWEKAISVTISYDVNGGNNPENIYSITKKTVYYQEPYGALPEGITHPQNLAFAGWVTDDGTKVDADTIVNFSKDHTLHATWKSSKIKIHFDGNGALKGSMEDLEFFYGEKITLPECAFDDGDMFNCWGTDADPAKGSKYKPGVLIDPLLDDDPLMQYAENKEITLYATWYKRNYTIEYYDGFIPGKILYTATGDETTHKYTPIDAPNYRGLRFVGWTKLEQMAPTPFLQYVGENNIFFKAGEAVVLDDEKMECHSTHSTIQLYPVYDLLEKNKINVIFHPNGGTGGPGIKTYDLGTEVLKLPTETPERDRCKFYGWMYNIKFPQDAGDELLSSEFADVIVLYAKWEEIWTDVTLDYGYDNKTGTRVVSPSNPYLKLPKAERDGYVFNGWKSADGKLYQAGEKAEVPEGKITLTAQWEEQKYIIEYYDDETNKLLKTEIRLVSDTIDYIPANVVGREFVGWYQGGELVTVGSLASTFINTHKKETKYRLFAQYSDLVELENNKMVYYNLVESDATGGPVEPSFVDMSTNQFRVSTVSPKKPNCRFLGWSLSPGGEVMYEKGETYSFPELPGKLSVTLFACWESELSCVLSSNGCPGTNIPVYSVDALPGETVELKKYSKLVKGSETSFKLVGWGTDREHAEYAPDGSFVVPNENFVLYAIWVYEECEIVFRDGFSGQELYRDKRQKGSEINPPNVALVVAGNEFIGWTDRELESSEFTCTLGPCTYDKGAKIVVDRDMTLYSTYKELDAKEGVFTIHYIDNGGTGGPGTVYHEPGKCAISWQLPTRDGYTFVGWDRSNQNTSFVAKPDYPKWSDAEVDGRAGKKLTLYAVWKKDSSNSLKYKLTAEYGVGSFNGDHFDQMYESTDWEPVLNNNFAYYVIRTTEKNGSYLGENLSSTVLVMEYDSGEWQLKAYGTKEGLWDRIRLNILTAQTNGKAQALDVLFKVVDKAGEIGVDAVAYFHPVVGVLVKGAHLLDEATSLLYTTEYDSTREYLNDYVKVLVKNHIDLKKYMGYNLDLEKFAAIESIDDLDEFCKETLIDIIDDKVLDNYMNKGKKWVVGKLIKKGAGDNYYKKQTLTNLNTLVDKATSNILKKMAEDPNNLDPFGAYDVAFKLFKDRLKDQHFSSSIIDRLPLYINRIYANVRSN